MSEHDHNNQLKESCYWHNQHNRATHMLECLQQYVTSGRRVYFDHNEKLFSVCIEKDEDAFLCGWNENLIDAFFEAKDNLDHKVGK